jgi:hypothetical protein
VALELFVRFASDDQPGSGTDSGCTGTSPTCNGSSGGGTGTSVCCLLQ